MYNILNRKISESISRNDLYEQFLLDFNQIINSPSFSTVTFVKNLIEILKIFCFSGNSIKCIFEIQDKIFLFRENDSMSYLVPINKFMDLYN